MPEEPDTATLAFGDFTDYWRPGPKCPNCLEPRWHEDEPDEPSHMITDYIDADGAEHAHWTCEEAPEADREAAGYLVRFVRAVPMPDDQPDTQPNSELDMDVRSVAVIWNDRADDPGVADEPDISFEGCSPYEAFGLLVYGAVKLLFDYALNSENGNEDD
jgi:hypothetical protein